jgi:hypothetical protein
MLSKFIWSWNIPTRSGKSAVNHSRVKPFQGREGNWESLNASMHVTNKGANRNVKYRIIYSLKLDVYALEFGRERIIVPLSSRFVWTV